MMEFEEDLEDFEAERQERLEAERDWIDGRMRWLCEAFGFDRIIRRPILLPTPEYFPEEYDGTEDAARKVISRLWRQMDVSLHADAIITGDSMPLPADDPETPIDPATLNDPALFIARSSWEIAAILLRDRFDVPMTQSDFAPLADLVTIALGLGVFTANSLIKENYWAAGGYSGWSFQKHVFLSLPGLGYALALVSRLRGEDVAFWASSLRADVREAFDREFQVFQRVGGKGFDLIADAVLVPYPWRETPDEADEEADSDSRQSCGYCDSALTAEEEKSDGVCHDCSESMRQHDVEIAAFRAEEEQQANDWTAFYMIVGFVSLVAFAAIVLSFIKV